MTTKRVTLDDALDALRKAVAEQGYEYEYRDEHDSCYYATFVDGEAKPACIVGHALVYLGVPAEYLAKSCWNETSAIGALPYGVLRDVGYEVDDNATQAFHAAQLVQDSLNNEKDTSWGAALAEAERLADSRGAS